MRVLLLTPPPQVLVQAPKEVNGDCTQSMGQALVLQPTDSVVAPQALPPWLASR